MVDDKHSAELLAELEALQREHPINDELFKSLLKSKEEAWAHIQFFKRSMFFVNGGLMTLGLFLIGFGGKKLLIGFSGLGLICLLIGVLIFWKFATVFASMTISFKKIEKFAKLKNLI